MRHEAVRTGTTPHAPSHPLSEAAALLETAARIARGIVDGETLPIAPAGKLNPDLLDREPAAAPHPHRPATRPGNYAQRRPHGCLCKAMADAAEAAQEMS